MARAYAKRETGRNRPADLGARADLGREDGQAALAIAEDYRSRLVASVSVAEPETPAADEHDAYARPRR
jgi:hypothetical protein